MVRLLVLVSAAAFASLFHTAAAADSGTRHTYEFGADLSYINTSGYPSWTDGSAGKLRFDNDGGRLLISRAFVDYEMRLTDTLNANIAADFYDDDLGASVDFTEAYLQWRPLAISPNRYRLKFGAFYPRVSFENTDPGWSSPYTISSSAINTWIAEEIRIIGAEASVSRRPQALGGAHTFTLFSSIFYKNDPAGALLSWKGWSIHDRQTRFGDILPLPPIPQIQPGMYFQRQDPFVPEFREIDGIAGYYVGAEWQYGSRFSMRAMRYDNRGNPTKFEDGQYAWGTDFNLIGLRAALPGDIGLIYQWMGGLTLMGPVYNGTHVVDADFYSDFILLTKSFGPHRISARYDRFEVAENDQVPLDNNSEYGHAWTLAYKYELGKNTALMAEWLSIESYREAWQYFDLDESKKERQLQLTLRFRFGSHR